MHPVCIQFGDFKIHWFGVMMALGFLAGLLNWTWLGRRDNRGFNACSDLLLWIMVSGIIGARAAYVLSDLPSFLAKPLDLRVLLETLTRLVQVRLETDVEGRTRTRRGEGGQG